MRRIGKKSWRLCGGLIAAIAVVGVAEAATVKTLGKLDLPESAGVVAVCTDPLVQQVVNEDLRAARRNMGSDPSQMVTLTVTVNSQVLAPGASLNTMFPGDPSMVELLKAAGAQPPPLGDSGDDKMDPYEREARRKVLEGYDPTAQFKRYQADRNQMNEAHSSAYDNIPKNEMYDTVIVASASAEGSSYQFKVVAVVPAGEDARSAKRLVAEEIANAVLH
jgi:hypothetical protein